MTHRQFQLAVCALLVALQVSAQSNSPSEAIALEQQGKLAEAAQAWQGVIRQNPRDAGAYASLGVVFAKQEKYPEAAAAYRKAIGLNPKLPGIQLNLGLAEFKQGHFAAAATSLKAALAADPNNSQARTLLGLSYYGDKRFADAVRNLKISVKSDPSNVELQQVLAQSCLWAHDYPCALDGFRAILQRDPDSVSAHILVGQALDGTGKTAEAIAEFQEAAKIAPREPNVHFGLGFLYWKSHDYDKAKQEFEAELATDPNHAQALGLLGRHGFEGRESRSS